tara:strand:- start:292 stop:798 length:507 start_codon:yes stop_codon:yes gene_type:complete
MTRMALFLAAIVLASLPFVRQGLAASGLWATERYTAQVRIEPCPEASDSLCGTIVWLWDPLDEDGQPKRDRENPDRDKRGRLLVGTAILQGFHTDGTGQWQGGHIYNPEDGATYEGTLRLKGPGLLEVTGCVLMFCRSQTWRSAASLCPAGFPTASASADRSIGFTAP